VTRNRDGQQRLGRHHRNGWSDPGLAYFSGWQFSMDITASRSLSTIALMDHGFIGLTNGPSGPGEDFGQEPGSVSGFRRYEQSGFDRFIEQKTNQWWNDVHSANSKCGKSHPKTWDQACRYTATLKIWHMRSGT
jgi:hypothetical protein